MQVLAAFMVAFAPVGVQEALGQNTDRGFVTPNGYLDTLFDHYGNAYSLSDLQIENGAGAGAAQRVTSVESAGIFNLYFEERIGY